MDIFFESVDMSDIFFKSAEHKKRFVEAMQEIGKSGDAGYAAAIYILTADHHTWEQAKQYIDHDGIDFADMIKDMDLTSGTYVLLHLAGNLFGGIVQLNADKIAIGGLDESNFKLALDAIRLRHYGLSTNGLH